MNYNLQSYDAAFENFTNVLKSDGTNIAAMEKRAHIHFKRAEFDECIVECKEVLSTQDSADMKNLLGLANDEVLKVTEWFDVLQVLPAATKADVEKSFRSLAKKFSPNSKQNAKLMKIDKRKVEVKMSKINIAKKLYDDSQRSGNKP